MNKHNSNSPHGYQYEYKGRIITLRARATGVYAWINKAPFARGNHKASIAGQNFTTARQAAEYAIRYGHGYHAMEPFLWKILKNRMKPNDTTPFTAEERGLMAAAINRFGSGQHPAASAENVEHFTRRLCRAVPANRHATLNVAWPGRGRFRAAEALSAMKKAVHAGYLTRLQRLRREHQQSLRAQPRWQMQAMRHRRAAPRKRGRIPHAHNY